MMIVCLMRGYEYESWTGDLDVLALQLVVAQGVLVHHDLGGLELQDHEGRNGVDGKGTVGSGD